MTLAQRRLLDIIRQQGGADGGAEYWPAVNDWVKDQGRAKSPALLVPQMPAVFAG